LRRVDIYYGLFRNICYRLSDGCKDGHYTVSTGMLTHTCTECKYRYCLDTLTHTCSECLSSSPSCQITNCVHCDQYDDRICAWCKVGWVKSDGQCYLDGELPPMCVDMIGDRCSECEYEYSDTGMKTRGHYADITGQCQPCPAHCEECTDNTTCTRCISRYLLLAGTCSPCPLGCLLCYSLDTCDQCSPTHYPSSHPPCMQCPRGCMYCSGEGRGNAITVTGGMDTMDIMGNIAGI